MDDVDPIADAPRWAEVPWRPVQPARRDVGWARWVLAAVIGVVGPVARTLAIAPSPGPVVVAVVGVVGLVVLGRTAPSAWSLRLVLAAAAGAACVPSGGRWVGAWMAAGLLLACWVALERPPLWAFEPRPPGPAAAPVVVVSLVAAWVGRSVSATYAPLVLVAAGALLAAGGASTATRIARRGRDVLGAVLLFPLWLVAVLLPWPLHRALRVDPLAAPLGEAGTVARRRATGSATRLWVPEVAADRLSRSVRLRRALVAPLAVLLVVVGVAVVRHEVGGAPVPAAMAGVRWWPEYRSTLTWYEEVGFDPLRYHRQSDVRSPLLNVVGGMRRTWRAPPCGCRRLTVWVYGGSTIFGYGQRDDETIPSELARIAAADGITIDVENRGVSGDTQWVEAQRFAWDVAAAGTRPDLVIFYDGANEITSTTSLNEVGRAQLPEPPDLTVETLRRSLAGPHHLLQLLDPSIAPDGARLVVTRPEAARPPGTLGRLAAERYARSRSLSVEVAAQRAVPTVWFWQPTRLTRPPVRGETPRPPADERWARTLVRAADRRLPAGVIDLSHALDRVRTPLFYDDDHTNEDGARLVAMSIFRSIEPQLVAAEGSGS